MQRAPKRRNNLSRSLTRLLSILVLLFAVAPLSYAASGTISSSYKYAWGNVAGWVNFAPAHSAISVTDSSVTGYAWSTNDGWINLSPSHSGVTNNGSGTLGGFAWDPIAGWVSFTGVTIDSSGTFHGKAIGSNGYAINFNCTACNVQTSWRPASTHTNSTIVASPQGSISPVFVAPQPVLPSTTTTPTAAPVPPASQPTTPTSVPSSGISGHGVLPAGFQSTTTIPTSLGTSTQHASATAAKATKPHTMNATSTSSIPSLILPAVGGISLLVLLFFVLRFFLVL